MTREKAINLEAEVRYSLTATKHKEAMDIAFAALREQKEGRKGCEWCWHFRNDPQYLVSRGNGMYDEVIFKFCPACGKKLEVEE